MADTLRLHVGRARFAPSLAALLIAGAPALSTAQGPTWNWVRTLDAGNTEYVRDIAIEPVTGNIYVTGAYKAVAATVAPYGLPATDGGSVDAFVAKLDPNGNLLWSRGFGSTQEDAGMGVAVALSGLVVVTGYNDAAIPALSLPNTGQSDAFIAAYDASGAFQWSKNIGGTQWDEGTGVVFAGNTLVAYGSYTHQATVSGVPLISGAVVGRTYAYLNAYNLAGTLQWSLTGSSNDDILTERIAADASNVYVVGGTVGNAISWQSSLGASLTSASTTNTNALFASAVSLSGTPVWVRMIDNPGDSDAECNGVAVHCSGVYITGHSHNSSVFPGGITRTITGVHDYWFLASLSTTTGTTNWVRTASSSIAHGADGYDVSVGRNGQIHVAGALSGTVTTDGGTVIGGGSNSDICIARFNSDSTAVWYDRELSTDDEWPLAIAAVGNGNVITGGWYEDGLTLGSNTYPGTNGTNLFTASFTDPVWSSVSNNPARFAQPGPFCSNSAPVDLNNYLVAFADSVVASSNVTSPQEALGAPNSLGAYFNSVSGWEVLDLGDTVTVGEAVALTWRSQTNLIQARMLVSSSLDGVTWSAATTYSTTSGSFITTNYPVPANARFIRVQRHSSALYTGFHLDALRYLGGTYSGGTWSGGPYVTSAGLFTPGAAGSYAVTYTVVAGGCTYTHSRTIVVLPTPVGGSIAGGGTFCPGASGTLTLSGHSGIILRWERSANGTIWLPITETSATLAWSGITGTMLFRVVIDGGLCGTETSAVATVIVEDTEPPTAVCPPPLTTLYVPSSGCTVAYTVPLIASSDNCLIPAPGGVNIISNGNVLAVNGTAIAIDEDVILPGGTVLLLGPGTHTFTDTISDASGNIAVCNWQVNVLDTIAPVFNCNLSTSYNSDPGACGTNVTLPWGADVDTLITDNCDPNPTWTQIAGPSSGWWTPDTVLVTYQAVDASGNTSTCTFSIIVGDYEDPVVTCPGTISLPAGVSCKAEVPDVSGMFLTATDNCTNPPVMGQDVPIGSLVQAGDIIRITATDASGRMGSCPMTVVTIDSDPPVFDNCPGPGTIAVNTDPNSCEHLYTFPTIESTDNCDADTESDHRTFILEAGNIVWQEVTGQTNHAFAPGLHELMEIHRDDSFTQDTCFWSLDVADANAPTITCPNLIAQLNAGTACTVALPDYTTSATVNGNCSGNAGLVVTQSPAPGTARGIGTHLITLLVSQGGQSDSCSFVVNVADNTPPTAVCAPVTLPIDLSGSATITAGMVNNGSSDNCTPAGSLAYTVIPASATCSDLTTALLYRNDFNTDINLCSPTDEQTATGFVNVGVQGANGGTFDEFWSFATASPDRCLTVNRTASGNTARWQIELTNSSTRPIHGLTVSYDMEVPYVRLTNTTPRSAQLQWYFDTDGPGPLSFGSAIATSPTLTNALVSDPADTQRWLTDAEMDLRGLSARGLTHDVSLTIAPGQTVRLAFGRVGGGPAEERNMNYGADNVSIIAHYTSAVALTVTDLIGNSSTCTSPLTLLDQTPPTIICPANVTTTTNAQCSATGVVLGAPVVTDACSIFRIENDAPSSFPVGTTVVTWTVFDAAGNSASCAQNVVVNDNIAPTINGCPANMLVTANPGACNATASWMAPSVTDNCPGATISQTAGLPSASSFPIGTTTITYTASDGANTDTCSFDVVVQATAVDIAYSITSICQGSAPILPSIASPAGGVFSDANQNGTINTTTGAFDPSVASPGLHTLDYVFAGACTSHDGFTIEVVAAPTAVISYADSPFCSSEAVATMTHTGTTGGTFTAVPSLSGLSSTTGNVDLTAASPDTYTVTYTIPASGVCPAFSTSTSLTIEQAPDASIAYAGPYCNNTGPQAVTFSGTAGGSFTATPAGLTLDGSTGQIVPGSSASTSTGATYTVTYSIPATSACPDFSTTANVTITQAPWAGTNGSLSICSNAAPVNLIDSLNGTPAPGGSWNNPANAAHSGVYDPAVDGPGTYTYTVAGGPGCAAHSAVVQVTETSAILYYADQDGDNAGDPATSVLACAQPVGYVSNSSDGCPFDVNKIAPGFCGCGVADTDTDADGTADCIDGCPNDPNKTSPGLCGCGQAEPGSPCDDGDPGTANDVINASCQCVGQLIDCLGVPGGTALVGTACNDNNANTGNDTWDANCVCTGQLIDCLGVPGGSALSGTACDDGLATTGNDLWDANCVCAGQLIDCLGVPGGSALPGTACDDGNANTGNDTWDANCVCVGQLIDCLGVPGGSALVGTACDDGLATTGNDLWDANCVCAGQLIDCCLLYTSDAADE